MSHHDPPTARIAALGLSLLLSLACMTSTLSVEVTHPYEPGDQSMVWIDLTQEMDQAYLAGARAANTDIRAQCQDEGIPCDDSVFLPETYGAFVAEPMFATLALDPGDPAATRTETASMVRYRRGWSLPEYQEMATKQSEGAGLQIQATLDSATGAVRYVTELTVTDLFSGDPVDWSEWDAFMNGPEPAKPSLITPPLPTDDASFEGGPALAFPGLDRVFSGLIPAVEALPGAELQAWHYQHILRSMDFPVALRFVLDPPGDIVSATFNGQPGGAIPVEGGLVVFAVDETFLRRHATESRWVFRVESIVQTGSAAQAQTTSTQARQPEPQRYRSFRIRLVRMRSFGIILATLKADYVLQALDPNGEPGPSMRIRFTGYGLGANAAWWVPDYTDSFGGIEAWTEFQSKEPMALRDFDGVWGYHSDAGLAVKSWTGAVFCTSKSPFQQQAQFNSVGTQVGLYGGLDATLGKWRFADYAEAQ
ncbi:MAG: hypothetical protein R6X16_00355 [Anaerolineae bacterium]